MMRAGIPNGSGFPKSNGVEVGMAWLQLRNITFSYGGANILEDISLQIQPGERIGLMGRNGAGKSTLMKLIGGELKPDAGEIERGPNVRIARLAQEVPSGEEHSVFDEVADGLGEQGRLVARIHALTEQLHHGGDAALQTELDRLQHLLDSESGWKLHQQVDSVIE